LHSARASAPRHPLSTRQQSEAGSEQIERGDRTPLFSNLQMRRSRARPSLGLARRLYQSAVVIITGDHRLRTAAVPKVHIQTIRYRGESLFAKVRRPPGDIA